MLLPVPLGIRSLASVSLPRWRLGLVFPLLLAGAWAQIPVIPAGLETPVSAGADVDLADGDEVFAAAQQTLLHAQTESESLRALDTVVNLLRRRGDYAAGLTMARDGLERARKLGDPRLEVEFLYMMGRIYWNLTDYHRSFVILDEVFGSQDSGRRDLIFDALANLKPRFPQMILITHLEELKLVPALGDQALMARTHGALGLTYERFGNRDDARRHFDIALRFAQTSGDQRQLASILNSLGNYHLGGEDYDRAQELHQQALTIRRGLGQRRAIADSLTNLGLVADAQGDQGKALAYLQSALTIYQPLKLKRYIANTHRRLATVLRKTGQLEEALAHIEQARDWAADLGSAEVLAAIYHESALIHEARGEFAEALAFEREHTAASEGMRGVQDRQRMNELRAHYNAEQRELEIALLRRDQELKAGEIDRRQLQNMVLGIGLALGVVVLGAVILVQRLRMRAQRRLHAATGAPRPTHSTSNDWPKSCGRTRRACAVWSGTSSMPPRSRKATCSCKPQRST